MTALRSTLIIIAIGTVLASMAWAKPAQAATAHAAQGGQINYLLATLKSKVIAKNQCLAGYGFEILGVPWLTHECNSSDASYCSAVIPRRDRCTSYMWFVLDPVGPNSENVPSLYCSGLAKWEYNPRSRIRGGGVRLYKKVRWECDEAPPINA